MQKYSRLFGAAKLPLTQADPTLLPTTQPNTRSETMTEKETFVSQPFFGRLHWLRLDFYTLVLLVLFGFGLYLRLYGLPIGLPYVVPADESLLVDSAVHILKTGSFAPNSFYYPTLLINLETAVFFVCFLWGTLTGQYHSLSDLPDKTYFITTAPNFYLWGRAFTAVTGALAVLVMFGVVKAIWRDKLAATLAAGFVALSALLIENSHYIATDMPMATLDLLALYPCWKVMETGQRRYYIWSGVIIGLSIGTKFNGGLGVIMLIVAHLFFLAKMAAPDEIPVLSAFRRILNGNLILSIVAMGLAFLATTPDFITDLRPYTDAFVANYIKYQFANPGTGEYASATPWLSYLSAFWHDSPIVMLLAAGGLLWFAFRHTRRDILVLTFPLIYFISINGLTLVYIRNGLVVLLFFQLWAGLFASRLIVKGFALIKNQLGWWQQLQPAPRYALSGLLLLGVSGVIMFGSIRDSLYGDWYNSRPITYLVAQNWLEKQAGPGTLKLVEMRPQQWGNYPNTLAVDDNNSQNGADDHSIEYYRQRGIVYLAVNDQRAAPALAANKGNYPAIYHESKLVDHVIGKNDQRLGPDFSVLNTGASPATLQLQHPLPADFGQELHLLGFNLGAISSPNQLYLPPDGAITSDLPNFKPGQTLGITLYWQVIARPAYNYVTFIHIVPISQPDTKVAQRDTPPLQGAFPTSQWQQGQLVTDEPNLALPANLAPGQYQIVMGLYRPDGKFTALPLANGQSSIVLATITVK